MSATEKRQAAGSVQVLERGWLSSNNVLLHGGPVEGATLIDTGHLHHADQTLALVRHALGDTPLTRIINTHLHSDHCGGNACLQRAFGASVRIPPGQAHAVHDWNEHVLGYIPAGQSCARFTADAVLASGSSFSVGGRRWDALAAPGHDPHALLLFEAAEGLLISADALWGNGFGVVFSELEGQAGFDEVEATLDVIASLPVRRVIPGHGEPFDDVDAALGRARTRLASFRADPTRHARYAGKALLMYHLLEVGGQPPDALQRWLADTPLMPAIHARSGRAGAALLWYQELLDELIRQGALRVESGRLVPS